MGGKLCFIENFAYFGGWTFACFWSLYNLFTAQTELMDKHPHLQYSLQDLTKGWRFIRRLKDESDVEWSTFKYFIHIAWFYMLIQFAVSEVIRRTQNDPLLKLWYIISSIVFISYFMGLRHLFVILIQPVLFITLIYFGGKIFSIWVLSITLLMLFNTLKNMYYFWDIFEKDLLQDEEVFLILYGIGWVKIRCISFCVDYVEKKNVKTDNNQIYIQETALQTILNMFSYVLYLPILLLGPFVLYEDFKKSFEFKNEKLWMRLRLFIWDMIVFQLYSLLLDLTLHYIYFYALQTDMEALYKLPKAALSGAGLWMGLEFHMKYVVSYGTTAAYCRLDNIEPPPTPRCIARIHVYSHMWRYFDVGLYKFLVKYIYKPIHSQLCKYELLKVPKKEISSLVTFIFIFLWHGTTWNIFVWSALNYIGILLEYSGKAITKTEKYVWFRSNVLRTEEMETRFIAALCVPLLMLSAISNIYLFAGTEVGNLFFTIPMFQSFNEFFFWFISFYCCCHISIALQDVPSRTDCRKIIHNKTD